MEKRITTKATLSKDERIFYAANVLRGAVPRSGLIGYFENTECDVLRDAHRALEAFGLSQTLDLLQNAERMVLNGRSLPDTDQYVTLFDYSLRDDELEQAMNDLDERVRNVQNQLSLQDEAIFDALCRFADERGLGAAQG